MFFACEVWCMVKSLYPPGGGYSHMLAVRVCAAGKGMVCQAIYSGIGASNHRKLV